MKDSLKRGGGNLRRMDSPGQISKRQRCKPASQSKRKANPPMVFWTAAVQAYSKNDSKAGACHPIPNFTKIQFQIPLKPVLTMD